eukprot:169590-Pelagomonas_calceolata.AAC.1
MADKVLTKAPSTHTRMMSLALMQCSWCSACMPEMKAEAAQAAALLPRMCLPRHRHFGQEALCAYDRWVLHAAQAGGFRCALLKGCTVTLVQAAGEGSEDT